MTSFDGRERYSRAISFWIWTQTREREKTFHFISSSFFLLYSGRIHREFVCLDGKVEYVFSFWKCDGFSPYSSFTAIFFRPIKRSHGRCAVVVCAERRALVKLFFFFQLQMSFFAPFFPSISRHRNWLLAAAVGWRLRAPHIQHKETQQRLTSKWNLEGEIIDLWRCLAAVDPPWTQSSRLNS